MGLALALFGAGALAGGVGGSLEVGWEGFAAGGLAGAVLIVLGVFLRTSGFVPC